MFKSLLVALAVAALGLPLALMPDALGYFALDWVFSEFFYRPVPHWLLWATMVVLTPLPLYYLFKLSQAAYCVERSAAKPPPDPA